MTVLAVIPARMDSRRLPRKPLLDLAGEPLIVRVWRATHEACLFDDVIVATDAEEIADVVRAAGGRAVMTRIDHSSGTDRVAEAAKGANASVIVNIQGDQPFVTREIFTALIDPLQRSEGPAISTVAAPERDAIRLADPGSVKVVTDNTGRALYFSRAPIPFSKNSSEGLIHLGIYGFHPEALERFVSFPRGKLEQQEDLEQLRALENGLDIHVRLVDKPPVEINTQEDYTRAIAILREQI